MKDLKRLIIGLVIWAVVYCVSLYVIPRFGIFTKLMESSAISPGEITQTAFLIFSIILILVLKNGNLSFGFKTTGLWPIVKSVFVSILAVFLFFMIAGIMAAITGMDMEEQQASGVDKSSLNFLITVVIIASTCEEIFYRGFLYGFLEPLKKHGFQLLRAFISLPVIICAFLFGFGHLCLLSMMNISVVTGIVVSATLLGFIAGYYREKTGSLIPAVAAHMTFNIIAYGIPLIIGHSATN